MLNVKKHFFFPIYKQLSAACVDNGISFTDINIPMQIGRSAKGILASGICNTQHEAGSGILRLPEAPGHILLADLSI